MAAMQREVTRMAHDADAHTTVARVRLYDGEDRASQRLGFNCRAEDFLDLESIGQFVRDLRTDNGEPVHTVSELRRLYSADKPFVTAAYEVQPPLSEKTQHALGQLLVDGAFLRDRDTRPEGIVFLDNTGNQQPDHPLDSGRAVIAQTPIRP